MRDAARMAPILGTLRFAFWFMGPFVLLVERTPADAWLSAACYCLSRTRHHHAELGFYAPFVGQVRIPVHGSLSCLGSDI